MPSAAEIPGSTPSASTPYSELEDDELVRRAQAQDEQAFENLVRRHTQKGLPIGVDHD